MFHKSNKSSFWSRGARIFSDLGSSGASVLQLSVSGGGLRGAARALIDLESTPPMESSAASSICRNMLYNAAAAATEKAESGLDWIA